MRTVLVGLLGLMLLVGTGCGADNSSAIEADASGDSDAVIVMTEMAFTPDRITIPAGQTLTVDLVNEGNMQHDLSIEGVLDSGMVVPDERVTLDLGPFDGTVVAICTVPGHAQAGMTLVLESE